VSALPLRSLLFVPGDSDRKIAKGLGTHADALVLDLEDSVMPERKAMARQQVKELLSCFGSFAGQLWVRVNPLTTPYCLDDLAAVTAHAPAGILLPKCVGPKDVLQASHYLDALERREGIAAGAIRILAVTTETAQAPFSLGAYAEARALRLAGLTWGAEDLSAALGAAGNKDASGAWTLTYRMARSLCLLAAKSCAVQAIETLYVDYKDAEGLLESCREARREGFTGRFAIHPDQVEPINAGFMPTEAEVFHARRVMDAFAGAVGSGTVGLDGEMLDIPHLRQAQTVISLHDAFAEHA
jgi:citrate lyase subunit beta / citryl-CoA lyase